MGCNSSKKYEVNEDVFGFDSKSKAFFTKMGLTDHDLNLLYTSFYDMDSDSSGAIRIEEFLIYFDVKSSSLNNMIFSVFETDKCLSFMTYVTTLWYFLSLDTKHIGSFVYRMFDQKNDNFMSIPQIVEMMKEVNQDEPGNFPKIEASVKALPGYGERRTEIDLTKFMSWAETVQTIFMPITKTQFLLRERLIGSQFWAGQEERREKNKDLNDPLVDMMLRQKMSDLKFEHSNMMRKKQFSDRNIVVKGPGRNRFTQIMVQKLNKGNTGTTPVREAKGDISSMTGSGSSSSSGVNNKNQVVVPGNRRRRSVFKPTLVEKPAAGKKVSPSSGGKQRGT